MKRFCLLLMMMLGGIMFTTAETVPLCVGFDDIESWGQVFDFACNKGGYNPGIIGEREPFVPLCRASEAKEIMPESNTCPHDPKNGGVINMATGRNFEAPAGAVVNIESGEINGNIWLVQ